MRSKYCLLHKIRNMLDEIQRSLLIISFPKNIHDDMNLICALINGWVNNPEAGDLKCHHAHYDISVMFTIINGSLEQKCYHFDKISPLAAAKFVIMTNSVMQVQYQRLFVSSLVANTYLCVHGSASCIHIYQGSFCVCTQPMRDDVTL